MMKRGPLLLLILLILGSTGLSAAGSIRVGIYQEYPLNYMDEKGQAQGLFPDLLRRIFGDREEDLLFVPGNWTECLEGLQKGTLDMIVSAAYTKERSETLEFNQVPVLSLWGLVYTRVGSGIRGIEDLDGKRVGVLNREINGENFRKTAEDLGIRCLYRKYTTYEDLFTAVAHGAVDAAVASQHFGLHDIGGRGLTACSIRFSPYSLYFAVPKGDPKHLISPIDSNLIEWKNDAESVYYRLLKYWMEGEDLRREIIPLWLIVSLSLLSGLALLLIVNRFYLQFRISKNTELILNQEKQYRELVQGTDSLILRIGGGGRILFINRAGLELLRYEERDLIGRKLSETIMPAEKGLPDYPWRKDIRLIRTERYRLTNRILSRDGRAIYIQWSNRRITDPAGETDYILSIGIDVTHRRMDKVALLTSEARFKAFMNYIPAYTYIKDRNHRFLYMNKKLQSETTAPDCHWPAFIMDQNTKDDLWQADHRILQGLSEKEEIEFKTEMNNGEACIRDMKFPIKLSGGENLIGGISFDISEQKEMQEILSHSRKMQAVGELAGGIAHDFNNQLSGILGYGNMLADRLEDPKLRRYAENIVKGANRSADLTNNLLTFSRKGASLKKPVDMKLIIQEVIELLKHSINRNIRIIHDFGARDHTITGDPTQLQNAILNIALNARDAMPEGGVLSFSTEEILIDRKIRKYFGNDLISGKALKILIEDTGTGIPESIRSRIFEPFFTSKKEQNGTGMGLAMVYGTIRNHNGNIIVNSIEDHGTAFNLFLPLEQHETESPRQIPGTAPENGPYSVVIVDDEEIIRNLLTESLLNSGHKAVSFPDGHQAADYYRENWQETDLIILDMVMPEISGHDTYRMMKEINPDLKVLVCSGYSLDREFLELSRGSAVDILHKPFDQNTLRDRLGRFMAPRREAPPVPEI